MKRLIEYYNARARAVDANDFLKQVGHTERGTSITDEQFDNMVGRICGLLDLNEQDNVLDLCCGNGVITCRLAEKCCFVIGVDFSSELIEIAKQNHHPENVNYEVGDALEIGGILTPDGEQFSKVVMHGALQHFKQRDFERLLKGIQAVCVAKPVIVFGYVLEKGKQELFFDTFKRKTTRFIRRLTNRDVIGTWWDKAYIERTCKKLGLQCSFHEVDPNSDAAQYRFDLKVW